MKTVSIAEAGRVLSLKFRDYEVHSNDNNNGNNNSNNSNPR